MKSIIEFIEPSEKESAHLKIHELTTTIEHALALLDEEKLLLLGEIEEQTYRIPFSSVLYIEVVDKKTYLYTKKHVYQSKQRLYQLAETLYPYKFIRISKSMLVNVEKILSVAPKLSGRFEATLINQERVEISRKYVPDLKKTLGMGQSK